MQRIVKYLLSWSKEAVAPPLRQLTMAAAGLFFILEGIMKARSMNEVMAPVADAKWTALPNTKPSHSAVFLMKSFTISSRKHLPESKHFPHPMHPAIGLLPRYMISVSMPSLFKASATIVRAV